MASEGLAARKAALALLAAVLGEGRMIGPVAGASDGPLAPLAPADRARAQRLALATLRHLEPVDRILAPLLQRPPPLALRNILRLAVVELAVEGGAAHGVVNDAVTIARQGKRTASMAGLVNAVLRRLTAGPLTLDGQAPQKLPPWLRRPLVAAWGPKAVAAMERAHAAPTVVDLTARDGAEAPLLAAGAERLPTGSLRCAAGVQVSALPGYAEGAFWVQDAAAALAVPLLAPRPGERVLDLCAAPGGKTLQLAAAGAEVTALDISAPRVERVHQNLARTGLAAKVVIADALEWEPEGAFDAILMDAPCSATGTIRRHPDLPFVKDRADLAGLVDLQARLLDRALGWLRPGGRLVYCTCSLLPEEGEEQLAAALARHPGLAVVPPNLPGVPAEWITPTGGLRLRPDLWLDRGGMDGFFMARLHRA